MAGSLVEETIGALAAQLAVFNAALLALSAGHKIADWSNSRRAVQEFAGVSRFAAVALGGAALGEAVACATLLLPLPGLRLVGASLAACIWAVYLALIVRAIVQGRRDVNCGCSFGAGIGAARGRPLGAFHVVRNAVLLGIAILVAAVCANGSVTIRGSQFLAAAALLALYGALDQVMALRPLRGGEVV